VNDMIRKGLAIQVERKPVKDLFDLAFRAKQQAKKLLGHEKFVVLPTVHFDEQYKCYYILVEYDAPQRPARGLGEAMSVLSKNQ
jgi:hypothetical protein